MDTLGKTEIINEHEIHTNKAIEWSLLILTEATIKLKVDGDLC